MGGATSSCRPVLSCSPARVPFSRYSFQPDPLMKPRTTHSTSMRCARATCIERGSQSSRTDSGISSSTSASRWFGMMPAVCANHQRDIWVSTVPLPGIGVGSTTSNALRRSVAIINSVPSASWNVSRTLPRRKRFRPSISALLNTCISSFSRRQDRPQQTARTAVRPGSPPAMWLWTIRDGDRSRRCARGRARRRSSAQSSTSSVR